MATCYNHRRQDAMCTEDAVCTEVQALINKIAWSGVRTENVWSTHVRLHAALGSLNLQVMDFGSRGSKCKVGHFSLLHYSRHRTKHRSRHFHHANYTNSFPAISTSSILNFYQNSILMKSIKTTTHAHTHITHIFYCCIVVSMVTVNVRLIM